MADRKRPETRPQRDQSESDSTDLRTLELDEIPFGSVVRFIKTGDYPKVQNLIAGLQNQAKRLDVKPSTPVAGLPNGSDQIDVRSVIEWAERIDDGDKAAKSQLAVILATIATRLS